MKAKLIAGGLLAMTVSGMAQEKVAPRVNQVVYEVFSLDRVTAATSQRGATTDSEMYAQMLKGLKEGKVKQEKLQALRVSSGQPAQSEHVSEYIYAKEFEPPELPNAIGFDSPGIVMNSIGKPLNETSMISTLKSGIGWSEGFFPCTPAMGSAWDTIDLGDTLEVEIAGADPKLQLLSLRFGISHVKQVGFETWGQGLSEVKVPTFDARKIQSTISVKTGVPTLLGTVSPPADQLKEGEEPRVWFAFVTVTVVDSEK